MASMLKSIGFAAVLVLALFFGADASSKRQHQHQYSLSSGPFRPGYEYRFHYDVQTSSGYVPWVSTQKALGRMQTDVRIQFIKSNRAVLRLEQIEEGERHTTGPWDTVEIMDMNTFQKTDRTREETKQIQEALELPVEFTYKNGMVTNVKFQREEPTWSKNIKKAILSLVQINIRPIQKMVNDDEQEENSLVSWETKVEGECETLYTLFKAGQADRQYLNVTQSVNFNRCNRAADIAYGMQLENSEVEKTQSKQWIRRNQDEIDVDEIEQQQKHAEKYGRVVPQTKLERSTVYRYQLTSETKQSSQPEYGIKQVELVSQYSLKSLNAETKQAPHTVVSSRLILISKSENDNNVLDMESMGNAETLLYTSELEAVEKRFVMFGEEVEELRGSKRRPTYENEAEDLIKGLVRSFEENDENQTTEVQALETAENFNRLVEILRFSSSNELEQIKETAQTKTKQSILLDGLSVAASKNTIQMLVEMIENDNEIDQLKAAQVLKNLGTGSGLPAPSTKQTDLVLQLCKVMEKKNKAVVSQSCWLTFGSMVHELVEEQQKSQETRQQTQVKGEERQELENKLNAYATILMRKLNEADSDYEKVLYLKAIGNAGMPNMLRELKALVQNMNETPLIRIQAIEAMRFLVRDQQTGFKVRNALMPIFVNVDEAKHVRLAAIYQLLQTGYEIQNEKAISQGQSFVDQIVFVLENEKSDEVIEFVYSLLESKTESPLKWERNMAVHLKNALNKLRPGQEWRKQQRGGVLSSARHLRGSILSQENNEGAFVELTSVLPNHISLGLDTLLNGEYQRDFLKMSLCQKDMEQLLKNIVKEDGGNSKFLEGASIQLRSIFKTLQIRSRKSNEESDRRAPFALLSVKFNNMEIGLLPIDDQLVNDKTGFKNMLNNIVSSLKRNNWFQLNAIVPLYNRQAQIPTSSGMPLNVRQQTMLTTRVYARVEISKKNVEFKPEVRLTNVQEITVSHLPSKLSGVSSQRSVAAKFPMNVQLIAEKQKEIEVVFNLPEKQVRLLAVETLPTTFIYSNWGKNQQKMVKTITNQQLKHQLRHIQYNLNNQKMNLPFEIEGIYHVPRDLTSFKELVRVLMTTENSMQITFKPVRDESIKKIVLNIALDWFKVHTESLTKKFNDMMHQFYSKFQHGLFAQNEGITQTKVSRSQAYLSKFKDDKTYKHSLKLTAKTMGGRREMKAQLNIDGACDSRLRACEAQITSERSADESMEWEMKGKIRTLYPEYVSSIQELGTESSVQQKFLAQIDFVWGMDNENQLKMNIEGHPEEQMVQNIVEMERNQRNRNRYVQDSEEEPRSISQRMPIRPFLNQFNLVADYKLESETEHVLRELFVVFKGRNILNVNSRVQKMNRQESGEQMIFARFNIDSVNSRYANLSVETPTEVIHIQNVELPWEMQPMNLVRDGYQQNTMEIHSAKQWARRMTSELYQSENIECRVDGKQVRTFDGVTYTAPSSKCFTIVTKDCSNENDSKFAVLMKALNNEQNEQKIRVVTPRFLIESEPWNTKQIQVKVNGQTVYNRGQAKMDDLSRYDLAVERDQQGREWLIFNNEYVNVKFNGKIAKVQITDEHKNVQCGLCGNNNEKTDDEWRMNNNELTNDVKSFHKSYTVQEDSECTTDEHREFYNRFDDAMESSSEEDKENQMEPVDQTMITEYNHKICYSKKPVRQCPKGWTSMPKSTENDTRQKVSFTCLNRDTVEAKQIRNILRNNGIPSLGKHPITFVESVVIPERCARF